MRSWLPVLNHRLRDEPALVRVVVATVRGSAPREPGACMLIGAQQINGTIGGGHLELKATEIARQMLGQPAMPARLDRFALGATLGQCCGGAVNLWFERYDAGDVEVMEAALRVYHRGQPAVLVTLPRGERSIHDTVRGVRTHRQAGSVTLHLPIRHEIDALLSASPDTPRARVVSLNKHDALLERIDPQGHPLWLYGAGHVGTALVSVLADLPFQVTWIDSREHAFPHSLPAHVSRQCARDPAATVALAPAAAYFLVMTHSHEMDYEICRAILCRGDFSWAGLIGSETKAACFNLRFGRDDVPAASVARLVSPIGIDGIDSKLPGAIAISAAAQLLQVAQSIEQSRSNIAPPLIAGSQP